MTPKEKAEEMFHKFYGVKAYNEMCNMTMFEAKQCALIAVDEIINNINTSSLYFSDIMYWRQVKNEIEKL